LEATPLADVWANPAVIVRRSGIEGDGLFTTADLAEGDLVLRLGGRLVTTSELEALIAEADADDDAPYVDSVTVFEEAHLVMPGSTTAHFVNHSCDPNLWHDGAYEVRARRSIPAGEELTIDYGTNSGAPGFEMRCACGAPGCRARITSDDWSNPELQRRYRGHWAPALSRRIESYGWAGMEIEAIPGRDDVWRVGDTEFEHNFGLDSTPERFHIRKPASLMARYSELCPRMVGQRIVELGIAGGGSSALLALLARPSKLVACELEGDRVPALDTFIDRHGLAGTVRPFYGVDQSNRVRLGEIVATEFGADPIDFVIDDASHLYEPTLASFEVLFPRLRPDGLFIVEDWAADYVFAEAIAAKLRDTTDAGAAALAEKLGGLKHRQDAGLERKREPLALLGVQLLLASIASPGIVGSITIDQHWLTVRRGPDDVDAGSFRVADLYSDYFHWLQP
jgi:hypothetical protein